MTAKEFLRRGVALDKRVKARHLQIQYLRDLQTNTSRALSPASTGASTRRDRLGDITASIVDLTDEYARDVVELLRVKAEIKRVIDGVARDDYRLLLSLRYECFMTWEQVAVEMGYSWQHVHRIHARALEDVIVCDTIDML